MHRILIGWLLACCWISVGYAFGTGELTGRVFDAETRTPISGARVTLDDDLHVSMTRQDGVYLFVEIAEGEHHLKVEAFGYREHTEAAVTIRVGQLTQRSMALVAALPRLPLVVVSSSRPRSLPATRVEALSQQMLRERNVTTFDQSMEMVSGIQLSRSHGAAVQSLSVRGSSDVAGGGIGNRVLLLIDGRPALSPESGGALWSIVPTNSIDRIEVVKGAVSSLYGSSAMGGVINVITKKPDSGTHFAVHTNVGIYEQPDGVQYRKGNPLFGASEMEAGFRRGRIGMLLNLGRKASDGHSEQSAYALHNLYYRTDYDVDRDRKIRLTLGVNALDNDYPHTWISRFQPLEVIPKYGDDRQSKREFSADLYYHAIANTRTKYSSRFYYYRNRAVSYFNEEDPERHRRGNQPYQFRTHVDAQRLGHLTQLDVFLQDQHYLITGVDLQFDRVESSPADIMYGDHDSWNAAWYGQYEWRPSTRFTATAGLRYDRNQLVDGPIISRLSPRVSATYRFSPRWKLRLLTGQAFRAPSIAERFFRKEIAGGIDFRPNPNLTAERLTQSHELGITWTPKPRFSWDLAYYYNRYEDLIYWIDLSPGLGLPVGTLFQVQNLNRALMRGIDTSLQWQWRDWGALQLGYAYLDADDLSPGRRDNTLAYRIRHSFSYTLSIGRRDWHATLSGRYQSAVEEVFLWPNDEPPAFHVLNLRLSKTWGRLETYLSGNNLLNTRYEELARYRMPGRNWSIGVRANL